MTASGDAQPDAIGNRCLATGEATNWDIQDIQFHCRRELPNRPVRRRLRSHAARRLRPRPGPESTAAPDGANRGARKAPLVPQVGATATTPLTVSPAEVDAHLPGVDELERAQPLTRHLPHDSAHFRIDYHLDAAGALFLTIELRVVLNRADQLVAYDEELRTYRAEALAWLRSVGADPDSLAVTYRPPLAAESCPSDRSTVQRSVFTYNQETPCA